MFQQARSLPEQRLLQYDPGAWFLGTCLEFKKPPSTLERLEEALYAYERLPVEQQFMCEGMGKLCRMVLSLPEPEEEAKPTTLPQPVEVKRIPRRRVKKVNPVAVKKHLMPGLKSIGLDKYLLNQYHE